MAPPPICVLTFASIIKRRAQVALADKRGLTPLHHAAALGDAAVFAALLDGCGGQSALPISGPAAQGVVSMADACPAGSGDLGQPPKRPKAQQEHVQEQQQEAAAPTSAGRLPLCAAWGGEPWIVEQVLDGRTAAVEACDPSKAAAGSNSGTGLPLLHVAAFRGNASVAALLLKRGWSANLRGPGGSTALHHAALGATQTPPTQPQAGQQQEQRQQQERQHLDLVPWLWHPGVQRVGKAPSPVMDAHQGPGQQWEEVCQALVAAGADVLAADEEGRTVAMCAAGEDRSRCGNFWQACLARCAVCAGALRACM